MLPKYASSEVCQLPPSPPSPPLVLLRPCTLFILRFAFLLQMAPLGDRLLVKPKEQEEVRNRC